MGPARGGFYTWTSQVRALRVQLDVAGVPAVDQAAQLRELLIAEGLERIVAQAEKQQPWEASSTAREAVLV
jgi:hypothetical protein